MISNIDSSFKILSEHHPATRNQINALTTHFGSLPEEYVDLVLQATEIELQHKDGHYIRIWGPMGCIEMDEGYGISRRIPGAIPIGDDGGGHVIIYANGRRGHGLYHVSYGNLNADDAIWIAPTLTDLIWNATGISEF